MKYKKIFFITFLVLICIIFGGLTILSLLSRTYYPVDFGVSFHPAHAKYLKLDWQEVYKNMLNDFQPKYLRLSAPWNEIEATEGTYDFSELDWMFEEANNHDTKITLVVGQKIPRWPECHTPSWMIAHPENYEEKFLQYLGVVINRYKSHKALEIWQVENEPFIHFAFGNCSLYQKKLVQKEVEFVRSVDPEHKILMTDSGELGVWSQAARLGDYFGTTLYRIVRTPGGKIFNYNWLPPAFYRVKAKLFGIKVPEEMFISELQGEPWFSDLDIEETPLDIQMQTMSHEQLATHIDYVRKIGISRAYFWGVEWWYWMKTKHNDPWYWNYVENTQLLNRQEQVPPAN